MDRPYIKGYVNKIVEIYFTTDKPLLEVIAAVKDLIAYREKLAERRKLVTEGRQKEGEYFGYSMRQKNISKIIKKSYNKV
jgi:hypothetical protein